jgi:glycine/D-amino acid oxidase-like deaminating enzyme
MWPFRRNSARRVRSATPYWLLRNGLGDARRDRARGDFDVAILGAGISGALVADELIATGRRIVIVDGGEAGQGSTAASTALLQYEIDTDLTDLAKRIGAARAALAYRACAESFERLERRFPELLPLANYERRPSLYLAADSGTVPALEVELAARRAIGLECEWIDPQALERRFGCRRPGAILSSLGAQMDPLRFTRALLAGCERHGVALRTGTRVERIEETGDRLRLVLDGVPAAESITARDVVVCAGYESPKFLPAGWDSVADINNTFALVTEPLDDPAQARIPLVWEDARPYVYLRGTPDGRLMVGGNDVPFDDVAARELLLPRQIRRLATAYEELFGRELPPIAYTWAGSFAETEDGLPYIGPVPGANPRIQYVLAYGGNGITYSVHAGEIVRTHLDGGAHGLDDVFGFGRRGASGDVSRFPAGQTAGQRGDRASA